MESETIASFVGLTGASEDVARGVLGITGGDLNQAVSLYFDSPDIAASFNTTTPSSSSAPVLPPINPTPSLLSGAAAPARRRQQRGAAARNDAITISSDDDDDDFPMSDVDAGWPDEQVGAAAAASVARNAQEEEDAAMARRLQQELYGGGGPSNPEDVRAPISRTTETLVAPTYGGSDGEMEANTGNANLNSVLEAQFRRRREQRQHSSRPHNPFAQAAGPWGDDPPDLSAGPGPAGAAPTRAQRLAELFKPPFDLMERIPFDEARTQGREDKKWILINIQDMSDFNCQVLNRDIWKDEAIRQLVRENFLFLQYTKDDYDAAQYIQYYMQGGRHENPDNYPHVAVVDPRTGEQVKVWSGRPFPGALEFHAQLAEFLDRYSLDATVKNPVAKKNPRKAAKDIDSMTEEEMLQMAMEKSLDTANGANLSGVSVEDPDQLTASHIESAQGNKGKEVATDSPAENEVPAASAFTSIASDKPHSEPDSNPTTTRIQFRHPGGRIIRRFTASDPVLRIFEWLKAEPMEGKTGVEFELKAMPQGRDLIEDLTKSIEEVGLNNGTVMIEFIES